MNFLRALFRRKETTRNPRLDAFRIAAEGEGFSVDFSRDVARIIDYSDREGPLRFSLDAGSKGNHSITLEWSRPLEEWQTHTRERLAFERTKRFLEACGFEVEIWPSALESPTRR